MRMRIHVISVAVLFSTSAFAQSNVSSLIDGARIASGCKLKFKERWVDQAKCFEQVENIYLDPSFPHRDILINYQHERLLLYISLDRSENKKVDVQNTLSRMKGNLQGEIARRSLSDNSDQAKNLTNQELELIFRLIQP